MKKSKKRGSIFTLLLRNYIFFTLILGMILTVLLTVYFLYTIGIITNIDTSQIDTFEQLLKEQQYHEFPSERLLGSKGFIYILNQQQKVIYKSNDDYELPALNSKDIDCIPEYTHNSVITINNLITKHGQTQTAVSIKESYDNTDFFREYILDKNNNLIYQIGDLPMNTLSTLQFQLLTDSFSSSYSLQKHQFQTVDGIPQTMLLFSDRDIMETAMQSTWSSFLIILALAYGIMVLLFIIWLNRRIKKPLRLLSQELNNFESGKLPQASYKGPKEFVEIFDSFNTMSNRLRHTEEQRQHLENAKQKMLADISHDLKTPITVIQGYAKALCDNFVPLDEQKQYLKTIELKATGLNTLINTFYEYSKMEHPNYSLTLKSHDICNYLRDYIADRYDELDMSGFFIDINIPEQHIFCDIDVIQLKRAFDNIVNNSLKHNSKGTTLYFILKPIENYIQIILADDGIGIPPEIKQTIFEPFVVGEISRCNHGSGLGLSIAKKIIEAHNGKIQLKEPSSHYSTIYEIILPAI